MCVNQHNSENEGCQGTIGHCLIRQWPILLDAVMVGFWPFSLTVLIIFSSPSVSPLPPPLHSEVAPSAPPRHGPGGPRARPHPGPQSPGLTWASHGLRPLNPRLRSPELEQHHVRTVLKPVVCVEGGEVLGGKVRRTDHGPVRERVPMRHWWFAAREAPTRVHPYIRAQHQ